MRALTLASLLLAAGTALAGGKAKPPKPAPAAPAATPAPAPAPTAAPAEDLKKQGTADLMKRAKQLHEQLEYDQVLPLVTEVLARADVDVETQLDAYVLQGSCLAIVGNPIDAEGPFRRLLRGRPDFELPSDTPPKIMSVFRKVQAEEQAIARQMEEITRGRIIKEMQLLGNHPDKLKGGRPVVFDYVLKDPALAAKTVRVQYRKKGDPAFSSLALSNDNGRWRGQIPGEWTANDAGAQIEMSVETLDAKGPLLTIGPMVKDIAPGQVDRSSPPPLAPWTVWVGAGTSVVLVAAGAGFGVGMGAMQQAYDEQAQLAVTEPQDGSELRQKRELGETLGLAANGLFIASGVAAVATVVAGAFFTNWEESPTSPTAAASE